jgi:hypothetical protein
MEFSMFSLMKSEKLTPDHTANGRLSAYRQSEIGQFRTIRAARVAFELANSDGISHCYVVNESGQEYYNGHWTD